MTQEQFNAFWRAYGTAFPSTAKWVQELPDAGGTLGAWARVLAKCSLADCMEAIDRMLDGRADPVRAFDRELTAHHVRGVATRVAVDRRQIQHERSTTAEASERIEKAARNKNPPLAGLFGKIMEARDQGRANGLTGEYELKEHANAEVSKWAKSNGWEW